MNKSQGLLPHAERTGALPPIVWLDGKRFAFGFFDGCRLDPRIESLMQRFSRKNDWFAPVSTPLDHLATRGRGRAIPVRQRQRLEWAWLAQKLLHGTS